MSRRSRKHGGYGRFGPNLPDDDRNSGSSGPAPLPLVALTPAEEREKAKQGEPGYVTMEAWIENARSHCAPYKGEFGDPWTAFDDGYDVRAAGMNDPIF